jgi:hypothetical protein
MLKINKKYNTKYIVRQIFFAEIVFHDILEKSILYLSVWKCGCGCFSKCFLLENISK